MATATTEWQRRARPEYPTALRDGQLPPGEELPTLRGHDSVAAARCHGKQCAGDHPVWPIGANLLSARASTSVRRCSRVRHSLPGMFHVKHRARSRPVGHPRASRGYERALRPAIDAGRVSRETSRCWSGSNPRERPSAGLTATPACACPGDGSALVRASVSPRSHPSARASCLFGRARPHTPPRGHPSAGDEPRRMSGRLYGRCPVDARACFT